MFKQNECNQPHPETPKTPTPPKPETQNPPNLKRKCPVCSIPCVQAKRMQSAPPRNPENPETPKTRNPKPPKPQKKVCASDLIFACVSDSLAFITPLKIDRKRRFRTWQPPFLGGSKCFVSGRRCPPFWMVFDHLEGVKDGETDGCDV